MVFAELFLFSLFFSCFSVLQILELFMFQKVQAPLVGRIHSDMLISAAMFKSAASSFEVLVFPTCSCHPVLLTNWAVGYDQHLAKTCANVTKQAIITI